MSINAGVLTDGELHAAVASIDADDYLNPRSADTARMRAIQSAVLADRQQHSDEVEAMRAVMATVDPASWPGLTVGQRCALGRYAKPLNGSAPPQASASGHKADRQQRAAMQQQDKGKRWWLTEKL